MPAFAMEDAHATQAMQPSTPDAMHLQTPTCPMPMQLARRSRCHRHLRPVVPSEVVRTTRPNHRFASTTRDRRPCGEKLTARNVADLEPRA
jgi:hypothetical protein